MRKRIRRPSAATTIAVAALFFSLGGAGLAARSAPASSSVLGRAETVPAHGHGSAYADCAAVTGGGFLAGHGLVVYQEGPFSGPLSNQTNAGWLVEATNPTNRPVSLRAWAVCP